MRILIIEDESINASRLKRLLEELEPNCEILDIIDTVEGAVKWLRSNEKPDLITMDIRLADGISFSIFEEIKITSPVIFTTAYDEYALKAFKLNSIDYLLKPFAFERFYKGVLRLYNEQSLKLQPLKKEAKAEPKNIQEYIFLKVGHRIRKLATRNILFVEGMKDYLRIHTAKEKIMTLLSFARLEELLPDQDFAPVG